MKNISRSRFDNFVEEDLICPLCDTMSTGDENHYIFFCPFFNESRKKFIDEDMLQNVNDQSLNVLFNSSLDALVDVSNFVQEIMHFFRSLHS